MRDCKGNRRRKQSEQHSRHLQMKCKLCQLVLRRTVQISTPNKKAAMTRGAVETPVDRGDEARWCGKPKRPTTPRPTSLACKLMRLAHHAWHVLRQPTLLPRCTLRGAVLFSKLFRSTSADEVVVNAPGANHMCIVLNSDKNESWWPDRTCGMVSSFVHHVGLRCSA